jgi:hypothetical protein
MYELFIFAVIALLALIGFGAATASHLVGRIFHLDIQTISVVGIIGLSCLGAGLIISEIVYVVNSAKQAHK